MRSENILLNELDFYLVKKKKKKEEILNSLRLHRKLTQQESYSVLNTCWKFHWVWLRSENILLNELDFYLVKKKTRVGKGQFLSVWLENLLNISPILSSTHPESFIEFGCDLRKFY